MEIINAKDTRELPASLSMKQCDNPLLISCNWHISNNKQFVDAITTVPIQYAPARIDYEDVVSVDTCIALQPIGSSTESNTEPCMLNIEMSNCQRIARIAVVSEGNVLEIFKRFGEYETTILAEFIDEYEENIVFFGETMINPPTTEVSIKFIRTKNKGPPMWVYGIRLFLTDSTKEAKSSVFDYDIIRTFLSNTSNGKRSQGSEMAKKVFGFYDKQEILNREKILETLASGSRYDECINKIGRGDNEKEFPNCGDDCEQSNTSECKNGISETEYLNCRENYKKSDTDIKTCVDKSESKKTKPGTDNDKTFNYKDFIQTFLSNASNDKMSQEPDITRMFGFYDKHEIMNNEQFYHNILGTRASNSDYCKHKNEIVNRDNEKEREVEHEKLDSFEYKNRNIRNIDENCINCENYKKFDIDIRIYIDNKFHDMEKRLMERINEMEANTNQKLNTILERLG